MKLTTKRLVRLATAAQGKSNGTFMMCSLRNLAAHHEAAHAVVAVRLGFTVTKLDIQQRRMQGSKGASGLSNGCAEVDVSSLAGVDDTELLLRLMLYAAAPILLELSKGSNVAEACADDVAGLREYLAYLALPEPQAESLFAWAAIAAASILMQDDGDALNAVTAALRKHRFLRPSQLVGLIRDSDEQRAVAAKNS